MFFCSIRDLGIGDLILLKPKQLFNWLTRVQYNRRSNFAPLFIDLIIAGNQNGKPFLGHVSNIGKSYEDQCVATNFGTHFALPILRGFTEHRQEGEPFTLDQAKELIKTSMKVLYYRDCVAYNVYTQAICPTNGGKSYLETKQYVEQNWEVSKSISGF